jgi:glycosyltransferase involved in cell wall biosynthesis
LFLRGEDVSLYKGGGRANAPYEHVIRCLKRGAPGTERLVGLMPRGAWRVGLGSALGLEQATFGLQLLPRLRRERVDVLHVQEPQLALLVQRARRLGFVRTAPILGHGTNEPLDFQRKVTYLQHLAPWHLEQSRAAGVWKPTWTAIPNFIDTDLFRPGRVDDLRDELAIPRDGLVVLTVAAIKSDHKRIDYLLREFAQLRREDPGLPVWLVVAGARERDTEPLVAEGTRLLGDRARFLVSYPRPRMAELYRSADVFAFCSLREMMPIALLEATASSLPCVVNRHPIMEWMTGPGGEAHDLANPGVLAAALRRLLTDPERRRAFGESGRRYCLAHFSRDRVVDQIIEYYRAVVRNCHHSRRQPRKTVETTASFQ